MPSARIQNDSPLPKPDAPSIVTPDDNEEQNGTKSNNVDKPDSPKKPSDYNESEETKVKEDELTNEKNQNGQEASTNSDTPEDADPHEEKLADTLTPGEAERPKSSASRISRIEEKVTDACQNIIITATNYYIH